MSIKNSEKKGGSAFPKAGHHPNGNGEVEGMSLRDYFAAKVMQAMLPIYWEKQTQYESTQSAQDSLVELSFRLADAMLAERAK